MPTPIAKRILSLAWIAAVALPCAQSAESNINPSSAKIDCVRDRCDLFKNKGYHRVIVGQIDGIGTEQDVRDFYEYGLAHGFWPDMPQIERQALIDKTRLVWIRFGDGVAKNESHEVRQGKPQVFVNRIAVPMDLSEFISFQLKKDHWVRYSPHNPSHRSEDQSLEGLLVYNNVTGCVLFLCSPEFYKDCSKQYFSGVYHRNNGNAIVFSLDVENKNITSIDPILFTPKIQGGEYEKTHNK